jgi:hypothetical protein
LVREWWLLAIAVYISELRPKIDPDYIPPDVVPGKAWNYVEDRALNGPFSTDSHFVKGKSTNKQVMPSTTDRL